MTAPQTTTSTWTVDTAHSIVEFAVKHMMLTTVKGRFRDFSATLQIDEARPENSSVTATIDVASIDTNVPDRDAHLRSDDFLNAEKFPHITFRSARVERGEGDRWKVAGDLTIRDVTNPVTLDVEFEGRITDPWGNDRAAFSAETSISRKEFNVRWNQVLETGGVVVGDNVKISLHIEAVRNK